MPLETDLTTDNKRCWEGLERYARAVVEFPDWAELSLEMVGEAPIVYRKGWGSLGALLALGRKNSSLPWEEDGVSSCGS